MVRSSSVALLRRLRHDVGSDVASCTGVPVASGAAATTQHRAGQSVPRRSAVFDQLPAHAPGRTEANPPSHPPVLERLVIICPSVPPVLSFFRLARCPYPYFDEFDFAASNGYRSCILSCSRHYSSTSASSQVRPFCSACWPFPSSVRFKLLTHTPNVFSSPFASSFLVTFLYYPCLRLLFRLPFALFSL